MSTPAPAPKNWSDLDPFLKAAHLPPGQAVPATIDRIEFQTVHPRPGAEEIKPVMYFAGKQKGLILTSTNQDYLRATYGDGISGSYGKPVSLRAVRKTIAGRGVNTIIIGPPTAIPADGKKTPPQNS
jgi:hypothetical protein